MGSKECSGGKFDEAEVWGRGMRQRYEAEVWEVEWGADWPVTDNPGSS